MQLKNFDYNLPKNLIAQKSVKPRDHSRLMVINHRSSTSINLKNCRFFEIEKFLKKGDVLVLNDSKVIPARLWAKKESGGKVEILLLRRIDNSGRWQAMLRNFKEKEAEKELTLNLTTSHVVKLKVIIEKNISEGIWQIKFNKRGKELNNLIYKLGDAPIPPYVKNKIKLEDYQTVYAKKEGSVAAPTAGFHFTPRLIEKLKEKGVQFKYITLHIGPGTFLPIKTNNIENHKMHSEYAEINKKTADAINKAKRDGRRIIAVGTTSARTLEAFANQVKNKKILNPKRYILNSGRKEISLFIKPGYKFKIIDGLITNFHLPKTTLLILVSAFANFKLNIRSSDVRNINQFSGHPMTAYLDSRKLIFAAYQEAIKRKYRFYSFGDAMMII